jgi:hypothetical protein
MFITASEPEGIHPDVKWPTPLYVESRLSQRARIEAALFDLGLSRPGDVFLYQDYLWLFGYGNSTKDRDKTRAVFWRAGEIAKKRFGLFLRNISGVGYRVVSYDEQPELITAKIEKGKRIINAGIQDLGFIREDKCDPEVQEHILVMRRRLGMMQLALRSEAPKSEKV